MSSFVRFFAAVAAYHLPIEMFPGSLASLSPFTSLGVLVAS
jgi:hypothetical protein